MWIITRAESKICSINWILLVIKIIIIVAIIIIAIILITIVVTAIEFVIVSKFTLN